MPRYVTRRLALAVHHDLIETFGGGRGLRDPGRLEAAIEAPRAAFGDKELYPDLADKAAAYLMSLSRGHPFVDGNKRTAFAVADVFLRLNGRRLALDDDGLFELVLAVAQGKADVPEAARIFRAACELCD